MNESIVVYTSFALVSAIIGSLVTGSCMGWLIKQYQSNREFKRLQWEIDFKEALNVEQKESLGSAYMKVEGLNKQVQKGAKKDRLIKDLLLKRSSQRTLLSDKNTTIEKSNIKAAQAQKQIVDYHQRLTRSSVRLNTLLQENLNLKSALAAAAKAKIQLKPITVSDLQRGTAAANKTAAHPMTQPMAQPLAQALGEPSSQSKTPTTNSAKFAAVETQNTQNVDAQAQAQVQARAAAAAQAEKKADRPAEQQPKQPTNTVSAKVSTISRNKTAKANKKNNRLKAAQPSKDDLKQIKGIGPAIEIALNNIGIERLEQLAKLNKKEIKEVDQKLKKYTGRITRDNWVASAKKLNRKTAAA